MLVVNAELTSVTLLRNNLDTESATMLATIAKEKGISLCGIAPGQTEANFCALGLGSVDAILVASDLFVRAELTECNLRNNNLGVEGWTIIFNALRDTPTSKIAKWDLSHEKLGPKIAKPLAEYLSVTASLTALDVRINRLGNEGEALLQQAVQGRSGFDLKM